MYIRLNTITSDRAVDQNSRFNLFDKYSSKEDWPLYTESKQFGIIRPFPWTEPWPEPWKIAETEPVSWPKIIKKAVEDMSPGIRVNLIETSDAYIVQADLPGYNEDSIKIYMNDNSELILSAERIIEESEGIKFLVKERVGQELQRSVSIPGSVDLENSQAEFKDGVLTVVLPKDQTEKSRHIPLKKLGQKQLPSE